MNVVMDSPKESVTLDNLFLENVTVRYGNTMALDHVSASFAPGEIVGVLGHNGAGKSTLVKVASGAIRPGQGSLYIQGQHITTSEQTPRGLGQKGLSVVNQEPSLASSLSVWDNIVVTEPLSTRPTRRKVISVLEDVGLGVDLDQPVHTLSLGERQLLSIVKSIVLERSTVLLLDEPTAALGMEETKILHQLIKDMANRGTTVLYVSHRLTDVMEVTDRIVVLRAGQIVADERTANLRLGDVHNLISPGLEVSAEFNGPLDYGEIVAEKGGISVRAGEILGLYGMAGGKQFDLLESFFRDDQDAGGASIRKSLREGTTFVPADRERQALLESQSALDNVMAPWLKDSTSFLGIQNKELRERYSEARDILNVHGPGYISPISAFSGGNKQKHVIARMCLVNNPKLVLLAQPTQGVDVGARLDIVKVLQELASSGVAVIVASAEADEIELFCHRAWVVDKSKKVLVERSPNFGTDLTETLLKVL